MIIWGILPNKINDVKTHEFQNQDTNLFAKTEAFQAPKHGKSEQMPGKMRGLLLESLPDILPLP